MSSESRPVPCLSPTALGSKFSFVSTAIAYLKTLSSSCNKGRVNIILAQSTLFVGIDLSCELSLKGNGIHFPKTALNTSPKQTEIPPISFRSWSPETALTIGLSPNSRQMAEFGSCNTL